MLKIKPTMLLLALFLINTCSGAALVEYKMQTNKANEIIDCTNNGHNGKLRGSLGGAKIVTKNGRRMLSLNGRGGVDVLNSKGINAGDNLTYVATVKFKKTIGNSQSNDGYDAVFYKHQQFIFSRRGERFYCNFYSNAGWVASMVSAPNVKSDKWYHLALSFNYHNVPSQGETWTTIKLYVNGRCVASNKVPYVRPKKNENVLQLGRAIGFGNVWYMVGLIANMTVYSKTLTEAEIKKLVLAEKLVKPDFKTPRKLTSKQQKIISELREIAAKKNKSQKAIATALIKSIKNIAVSSDCKLNFYRSAKLLKDILMQNINSENMLKSWNKNNQVQALATKSAVLSIALDEKSKKFHLLGMNNLKNSREVFRNNSKLWKCLIAIKKKTYSFNALTDGLTAQYIQKKIKNKNGEWKFSIKWIKKKTAKNPAEFTAISNFILKGGRLAYDFKIKTSQKNSLVKQVTFPCMDIKGFANRNDKLLVPETSGVEYPNPLQSGSSYSGYYPTGACSMQLGAYYDDDSGVYFATEDPYGSSKSVSFQTDPQGIDISYIWKNGSNSFDSRSNAVFEIFNGNWYDAGLIYRKWVTKLNPPWWTKDLPRKDSPKWFRDNTLWFNFVCKRDSRLKWVPKIRKYLKLPFAFHWYSWRGDFDRDYPNFFPNPKNYDLLQELKAMGIRVVPYANGRLWETKDRREEEWQFKSKGIPASIKDENGKVCIERYSDASFGIMCPTSKIWRKIIYDITLNLSAFGFDGVYFDQISAARPRFCYDKSHGHLLGDHNTWFMKGYYPMFTNIRKALKRKYPEVILSSEDVSETYSKVFDGMLPWRWMDNGQIPLFPLVYSGRTQFVGLSFRGASAPARFPMLATQLVYSEQLGWFTVNQFSNVFNKDLRAFIKRLIHIRYALLDYFNQGMLGRPINFKSKMKYFTHKWGWHGSGYVKKPAIISSAWHFNKTTAFIMINTTNKVQKQKIEFEAKNLAVNTQDVQLHLFNTISGYRNSSQNIPFTKDIELKPYAAEVWIVGDKKQNISPDISRVKKIFNEIVSFANDKDIK